MITAITIENFKGISDPVRLELRPITLLFGQNSAGKSSLLHALVYAREVFERRNLDADRTLSAGDNLDLGGFRALVHNHDEKNKIRLRFDLNLDGVDLPGHWDPDIDAGNKDPELTFLSGQAKTAWVELTVAWSYDRPFVSEYETGINDVLFARIVADGPRKNTRVVDIQEDHPVFRFAGAKHRSESDPGYLEEVLADARSSIIQAGEEGAIGLPDQPDALPDLGRLEGHVTLGVAADLEQMHPEMDERGFYMMRPALMSLERILYQLLVGPGLLLRDVLRQFRYIGPQRQVPPRDFVPPRHPDPARWANGLAAWDLLYSQPELIKRVSGLLADPERFDLGYELDDVHYYQVDWSSPLAYRAHQDRLDEIEDPVPLLTKAPVRTRLVFRPVGSRDVYLEPADVGVGVSQMIPVLVVALDDQPGGSAALPVQLVAIEHPELNLHPRLQAELGDVFLDGALSAATKGRIFFIETHSEHLVLRLLRRIREANRTRPPEAEEADKPAKRRRRSFGAVVSRGGRKKTPSTAEATANLARLAEMAENFAQLARLAKREGLNPNDIGVWYVDRRGDAMTAKRILVDVEGEFVQPWPDDDTLFEQDFRERYT